MHWFWYFWIVSFIFCHIVNFIIAMATLVYIKRKGYVKVEIRKCGWETIMRILKLLIIEIIPFINIILSLCMLFAYDKIKDNEIKELLAKGKIKLRE